MIFGFRKRRRDEQRRVRRRELSELRAEAEALHTELELLTTKLNVELKGGDGDRSSTLSRYPRRIVELKIQIDEIERKIEDLEGTGA